MNSRQFFGGIKRILKSSSYFTITSKKSPPTLEKRSTHPLRSFRPPIYISTNHWGVYHWQEGTVFIYFSFLIIVNFIIILIIVLVICFTIKQIKIILILLICHVYFLCLIQQYEENGGLKQPHLSLLMKMQDVDWITVNSYDIFLNIKALHSL